MAGTNPAGDADRIRYVQSVYARVLDLTRPTSPDDEFFALGGTSLTAMKVIDLIDAEQGVRLPVRSFYRSTAIRELAGQLAPADAETREV